MKVEELATLMQKEFLSIHGKIDGLTYKTTSLQCDVEVLKQDVSELKQDVSELKETTSNIERVQRQEVARADGNEARIAALEAA